jgi:hypothetical protein
VAGITLKGFIGRIPCPHCGDTDCCGYDGEQLICAKTSKRFTDKALRAAARAEDLPECEDLPLANGWRGEVVIHQGNGRDKEGSVHLHSEAGHRGVASSLADAQKFAEANSSPTAHW